LLRKKGFGVVVVDDVFVGVLNIYEQKHIERSQEKAIWRSYVHPDFVIWRVESDIFPSSYK
jgi:hypothetical protein